MDDIIILIPAYKPSSNLLKLVSDLNKNGFTVVVVDDGSGKDYKKIFNTLCEDTILISNDVNKGKGTALKIGLDFILEELPDYIGVVTADADGQHSVHDIIKVSQELIQNQSNLILGCRSFQGNVPIKSLLGNKITKIVFALASGKFLKDTQTGLRAFSTALIFEMLNIPGDRYEYETNVLLWSVKNDIPIKEVKIDTIYIENNAESHFNPIKDSIKIYSNIFKFTFSSIIAFLIDFIALLSLKSITSGLGDSTSLLVSVILARALSSSINFIINRVFVFNHKENLVPTLVKYYSLVVCILFANYGLIYLLYIIGNLPLWIAKIITEILLFVASYIIQKRMIFKVRSKSI